MQIRPAITTDITQIMQVVKELVPLMRATGNLQWDDTYPNPEAFANDISLGQLWVADMDGDIGGVAAITTEQYPEYADVGLDVSETAIVVHRLAVGPRYQGKGIAVALLQQAETEAIHRGVKFLRIDTNSKNQAANALFPKLGYVFAGEIGLKFRPGMRFCCYEKKL